MKSQKNHIKLIILSIISISLTGCAYKIVQEKEHHYSFDLENDTLEIQLLGKNNFKWGLALSGGGIRSSAYSLGVMKALHEKEKLQKIEIISAVSGGGYAAYWLLSSESKNNELNNKFGDYAFSDKSSTANTCRFMTSANFVTYFNMISAVFKGQSLGEFYRCKIERTYGWNDITENENTDIDSCIEHKSESKTIKSYLNDINTGRIPYFVYNTTVIEPIAAEGWNDGLYEFTPIFRGNKKYGYEPWGEDESLPLSQISAISGAAIKMFLKQEVNNPHKNLSGSHIELSDGGHSENLGLISLIRRGVENIIVSDGEQDSNLTFESYYILKDRLNSWGLTLKNDFLDQRSEKSVTDSDEWWDREEARIEETNLKSGNFMAYVYRDDIEISKIYYIKASVTGEVKKDADEMYFNNGLKTMYESTKIETENAKICDFLNDSENKDGTCNNNPYMACEKLKGKNYDGTKWIQQNAVIRINNKEKFGKNFPHDSTINQSFYIDQFTSYMGLGYMQALKIKFN